jgi:hypothetical protein
MSQLSDPIQPRLNRFDWSIAFALLIGTLALYSQTRTFEYLRFDDPQYISQNWDVQSGLNSRSFHYAMTTVLYGNWHPLTMLAEICVVQLFGSSSAVFHVFCASLHAANVAMLFLFLRFATKARFSSIMVAALWGWHPLRAESVAWVGELKDVLCGFFWLMTMLAFARYRFRSSIANYLAVVVCAAFAMLAKPMAVSLPPALMLLNVWPLRNHETISRKWWIDRLKEQIPLVLLAILFSVIAYRTQSASQLTVSLSVFSLPLRVENALFSYARYFGKQLIPIHLGLIYPHPGMLGQTIPPIDWITGATLLILITLIAWRTRRTKPYLIVGNYARPGGLISDSQPPNFC